MSDLFDYTIRFAGLADIGRRRKENQDQVVLAPGQSFFAVSDGMGGLEKGGVSSIWVRDAMPLLLGTYQKELEKTKNPQAAADHLKHCVTALSDQLFSQGNRRDWYRYGATLAGVLLVGKKAVFVWLGDSRGYLLPKYHRNPDQMTEDMNIAGLLVKAGEMTKEEAAGSPASSRLTAFVGMEPPAAPEVSVVEVKPGDRILLCSDGLYGMVEEREIARILRSSRNPEKVCRRLIQRANENGGRDNISAVYIKIG